MKKLLITILLTAPLAINAESFANLTAPVKAEQMQRICHTIEEQAITNIALSPAQAEILYVCCMIVLIQEFNKTLIEEVNKVLAKN